MRFLGYVDRDEVRRVSQYRNDDRVMTELWDRYPEPPESFEFNVQDVGHVIAKVHYPSRNTEGPIREVFDNWSRWVAQACDEARSDRAIYDGMLGVLRAGGRLTPPVIEGERQIHDGRHRLFAMYEVFSERAHLTATVYWVHNWPDGVLAHMV